MSTQEQIAEAEYTKIETFLRDVAGHITAEDVEEMAKLRHAVSLRTAGLDPEPWEELAEGERAYERVNTVYTLWAAYKTGFVVTEPSFHGMPQDAPDPCVQVVREEDGIVFTCAACECDVNVISGLPLIACGECVSLAKMAKDHEDGLRALMHDTEPPPDSNARSWPRSGGGEGDGVTVVHHPDVPTDSEPGRTIDRALKSGEFGVPFGVLELDLTPPSSADDDQASAPSDAHKNGGTP